MQHGGPSNLGEHVGFWGQSSRPPTLSMLGRHEASEHAESEHAQDVWGSVEGTSRTSKAPTQIDVAVLMAMLTALQGSMAKPI